MRHKPLRPSETSKMIAYEVRRLMEKDKIKDEKMKNGIEIEIPKGFMNVSVTVDNYLIADTNDSANWDTIKFPLPPGNWNIYNYKKKKNNKIVILTTDTPIPSTKGQIFGKHPEDCRSPRTCCEECYSGYQEWTKTLPR